jgi:hypothetical protein
MSGMDEKDIYRLEFIRRVRSARASTGKKQWEIALAMGIKQDEYKFFEQTSEKGRLIPQHLIARFCLACHVDSMWLLSGHGRMKGTPTPELVHDEPIPVPKSRKSRDKRSVA